MAKEAVFCIFASLIIFILLPITAKSFFVPGYAYLSLIRQFDDLQIAKERDFSTVKTKWIEQPVDHFDTTNVDRWSNLYLENLQFWKKDGPVYIFLGGEGPANATYLLWGMVYNIAKETNGAMYMTEHRYYGQSYPYSRDRPDYISSFKYLSVKQALADLANFMITKIRFNPMFSNSKVVLIGGSYAGNLAAWMKLVYPELVDAAVASSAPVLAKLDFKEYLETVTDAFTKYGGNGCHDFIKRTFERYAKLLSSASGIEILKREENICPGNDLGKWENQNLFILTKASYFMSHTQYAKNINEIVSACQNATNDLIIAPQQPMVFPALAQPSTDINCVNYNFDEEVITTLQNRDAWTSWFWQICTEFSYATTTTSRKQIFTFSVDMNFFYKQCHDLFGEYFTPEVINANVDFTNQVFGGRKPNVKNVVFSNGAIDPWHRLSIVESLSNTAPLVLIPKASHCRDLASDAVYDDPGLSSARTQIKGYIKKWIGYQG